MPDWNELTMIALCLSLTFAVFLLVIKLEREINYLVFLLFLTIQKLKNYIVEHIRTLD